MVPLAPPPSAKKGRKVRIGVRIRVKVGVRVRFRIRVRAILGLRIPSVVPGLLLCSFNFLNLLIRSFLRLGGGYRQS